MTTTTTKPTLPPESGSPCTATAELDDLLHRMLRSRPRVSDLNLSPGRPPLLEADGQLVALPDAKPLTGDDTLRLTKALLTDYARLWRDLEAQGSCDLAYALPGGPRLRVNVFTTLGRRSLVLRVLPSEVPSFQSLGLPAVLAEIATYPYGLALVTGATGSGKSTTLAALIHQINTTRAVHIVTLEDPVEFRHEHRLAVVNQRELGQDFDSFASGLRAALRQAPKVILVGEMRDRETVEIALKAAETGHLVLSTLHTVDAGQTIGRIVGLFDANEQRVVRARLAHVLRMVVGQRLLPKTAGGRAAALEIMGTSLAVRELIQQGERSDRTFADVIRDGARAGWQTFDQHITRLFADQQISEEVALTYCSDRAALRRGLDEIKTTRGQETSDLGGLEMEHRTRRR